MSFSGKKSKNSTLRPAAYQLIPLIKLLRNGFNSVLISDGVGVGKTISAGYILCYFQECLDRPNLVVCPPMLVDKWLLELRQKFSIRSIPIRFLEDLSAAISETRKKKFLRIPTYVMASSLLTQKEDFGFENLGIVVFDEIHNYRNSQTLSHKAAISLSTKATHRVGLSATPINNSIGDLVSEFNILLPKTEREVLNLTVEDIWGGDRGAISLPLLTRFTKDKLGIHFARRNIKEYRISYPTDYRQKALARIKSSHKERKKHASFFEDVTYFRMAASSPAAISKALGYDLSLELDPKLELFKELASGSTSSHIVTFCEFEGTASYLVKNVNDRETFLITGDIPIFERLSLIRAFRNAPRALLVMTPVGTEGLDLQFCDTIFNYDLHWNPMKIEQRIGRIDRIGQVKEEIFVHNLIVQDSIDERVISVLETKLKIIAKSVFETKEILVQKRSAGPFLGDESSINKEVSKGQSLISAVNLSHAIPEVDYDVIKHVRKKYCSPAIMRESGEHNLPSESFLRPRKETARWLGLIDQKAKKLQDLIDFYR